MEYWSDGICRVSTPALQYSKSIMVKGVSNWVSSKRKMVLRRFCGRSSFLGKGQLENLLLSQDWVVTSGINVLWPRIVK